MANHFSSRSRVSLHLGLALALIAVSNPARAAQEDPAPARQADAFVESIGVNIHLHYTDTVYNDFELVRPLLEELGVRHVRDAVYTHEQVGEDHFFYQRIRDLGSSGISFNLLTSIQTSNFDRTDLTLLDDIQEWSGGAVVAFEGANEPDLGSSGDWVKATVELQEELWETVQGAPALGSVDVLGPSPVVSPDELPDLSRFIDYGNWHGYPGGLCVDCPRGNGKTVLDYMPDFVGWSGSAPVIVTETGYHTAVAAPAEETHDPVSSEAQAKYIPRLLLQFFDHGIPRTYVYELMDLRDDPERGDRESNFGLVSNDGTPKPAYDTLQNLITILEDPGPAFDPGELGYALSGHTDDVQTTLLQKRDGTFYLALWREVESYDIDARSDVAVEEEKVDLWLESPGALDVYRPDESSEAVESWSPRIHLELEVDDEVQIIAIRPPSLAMLSETSVIEHAIGLIPFILVRMNVPFGGVLSAWLDPS